MVILIAYIFMAIGLVVHLLSLLIFFASNEIPAQGCRHL